MSEYVYAGLTSQSIDLFIRDSASTTGQGLTGLAYNTSNLVASYRKGATGSRTAITLATQTVGGAFSSGGFVEIDATNMPGCYRLDLPNAAVDSAGFVTIFLKGAANMVPVALRIDCRALPADIKQIATDAQSATDLKDFADAGYDPSTNKVHAELDSTVEANIASAASNASTVATRLTSQRAANLDNLDVAISVIQSQITALNNLSAKANWFGSLLLEVPDSSTRAYVFELVVKDDEDKLVNLDASPTIALVNSAGTDRSSLITTAIANPSTGRYTLTITVGTGTVNESLKLTASGTVSSEARYAVIAPQVVDYDNATQVALLLTRIGTPSVSVSADIAAVDTKIGTPSGASVSADIASVKTDATTLLGRITSNVYQMFLDLIAMITGSGTADAGWDTAALSRAPSGSSTSPTTLLSTTIDTVTSQTVFTLVAGAPDNDVYNDHMAVITDASTSTQKAKAQVLDYVASTKTLTLAAAPGFTIASGDSIAIVAVQGLTAAQNSRLSLLGAGTRQTVKADSGASIELKIGDDYVAAISTAKRIEINDVDGSIYDAIRTESHTARSFGFGYIKAGAKSSDVVTGTIDRSTVTYTAASGSVKAYTTVFVEMSVASTLAAGCGKYDIQVTHSNGKKQTLFSGDCELVTDYKS